MVKYIRGRCLTIPAIVYYVHKHPALLVYNFIKNFPNIQDFWRTLAPPTELIIKGVYVINYSWYGQTPAPVCTYIFNEILYMVFFKSLFTHHILSFVSSLLLNFLVFQNALVFVSLRRQLRKAVVDHVSDSFLEPDTPLLMLLAAAREGHEKEVEEFGDIFTDHARYGFMSNVNNNNFWS